VPVKLAPSILAADFGHLSAQIQAVEAAGADYIHIDVMDGQFVPNISFGLPIVAACRAATRLPLDVHLMIAAPERYLHDFAEAGADLISVHAEATPHVHRALQMIHDLGKRAGLAVNPGTPLTVFQTLLPDLDLALIMSVNPGFGGQRFISASRERLALLRQWRDDLNPNCEIEVDGGVEQINAQACVEAGADVLVAGSAVFGKGGPLGAALIGEHLAALRAEAGR
jgi:ribulose-phosphate 3-epimerase